VLGAAGTILAASFVIFLALSFAPGDPVSELLGSRATDEARELKREELGLDSPVIVRYGNWLLAALQGDFGTSYTYRQDVSSLIAARIPTTALLVALAALLLVLVGVGLGIVGGLSNRWRPAISGLAGLGIAIPAFVAASLLISVFAVQLGWFPTYGSGEGLLDQLHHLALPALALSIGYGAYITQVTVSAVSEESGRGHVLTSRARGVPSHHTIRRHVLRNSALPVLTVCGLSIAGLVAGAVVVEQAFAVDGIGSLLVASVSRKDYPVVIAISMLIVTAFVIATTIIDTAQVLLDPRQRDGR
jgi:peptide/nickel transport system permease protein